MIEVAYTQLLDIKIEPRLNAGYGWLDKVFTKNETTFKKAYTRDYKQFMKYRAQNPTPAPFHRAI